MTTPDACRWCAALAIGASAAPSCAQGVPGWSIPIPPEELRAVAGMGPAALPGEAAPPRFVMQTNQEYAWVLTNPMHYAWEFDGRARTALDEGLHRPIAYPVAIVRGPRIEPPHDPITYLYGVSGEHGGMTRESFLYGLASWDGHRLRDVAGYAAITRYPTLVVLPGGPGCIEPNPALIVASPPWTLGVWPPTYPVATGLARWDGQRWSEVGGGTGREGHVVRVLAMFDEDGEGPNPPMMFAGGAFTGIGTSPARGIARWDGAAWSTLGGVSVNNTVHALAVFDADGDGPEKPQLYIGGFFPQFGDGTNWTVCNSLARWDGTRWSTVPGWEYTNWPLIYDMIVWDDDGPGPNKPALFVCGRFPSGGSIRKWDGQAWHALGTGLAGSVGPYPEPEQMAVYDEDGPGPNPGGLYVLGNFYYAGGQFTNGFARWGLPITEPCYADCEREAARSLDIFDFLCFQRSYLSSERYACDCDVGTGWGICDLYDFLCFQNAFAAGCP